MAEERQELRRSLKARHMNMIAIGGAIGTGLFVAGGETVSSAGPGGALVAYSFIGVMVYFLMTSLGEMAAYLPVSGSFETYANRYVDKSLGFALGWNYWFNWAITLAAELVAGALIMKYWFPDIPASVWSGIFLVILFSLNYLSTRSYGESEFLFASIKVITVITFLIVGTLLILGVGGESPGFVNWTIGDAPFVGGGTAILGIFMVAGFSFQGTEMIGIAAGESEDPEKNIPKAVHSIFWRILLFYLGAFIVIGFLIPYTDPNLLNTDVENISISPFTLVFERFGLVAAASVMNAVILTAVLSAGNSGLYVSTRMLYAMAKTGQAPKLFSNSISAACRLTPSSPRPYSAWPLSLPPLSVKAKHMTGSSTSAAWQVSSHGSVLLSVTIVSAGHSKRKTKIFQRCLTRHLSSRSARFWPLSSALS